MEASHDKNQGTRPSSSVPPEQLHNGTSTRHNNKLGAAKRQQQSASTSSALFPGGPPAAIPTQMQQQHNITTQQVLSSSGASGTVLNPRGPPAPPDIDSSLRTLSPLETPEKVLSLNAKARMKLGVENKVDRIKRKKPSSPYDQNEVSDAGLPYTNQICLAVEDCRQRHTPGLIREVLT